MGSTAGTYQMVGALGSAAGTGANAYAQANASRLQGQYARKMGNLNASMMGIQADDAIWRGEEQARQLGIRTRQLIGEQKASAAAQGVQVNSGSPLNLQTDAAALSVLDQSRIRRNARNEAMGLQMGAANEYSRAAMAYRNGRFNATNTLLAGGVNAVGQVGGAAYNYYRYTPPMQVPTPDYNPRTEWYNPYA